MAAEHIIFRIGLFKKERGKIVCQKCKKENKWNYSAKYTRNSLRHLKETHAGTIYKKRYDELLEESRIDILATTKMALKTDISNTGGQQMDKNHENEDKEALKERVKVLEDHMLAKDREIAQNHVLAKDRENAQLTKMTEELKRENDDCCHFESDYNAKMKELVDKSNSISLELAMEVSYLSAFVLDQNAIKSQVIVSGFELNITRKDLLTLSDGKHVNDQIINFYMNLIAQRNCTKFPKVYTFNTFFYPKLSEHGYNGIKRWLDNYKLNIFEYQLLLVPIHFNVNSNGHWALVVVNFEQKHIDYYDSLHIENQECLRVINEFLFQESVNKRKEFDENSWTLLCRKDISMQTNSYDCGVFLCAFAECLSCCIHPNIEQYHIPYLRKKILYEICKKI